MTSNSSTAINEASGLVPFVWEGQTFQTWYKVFGDLNSLRGRRPLVVIHGGLGWTHDYMLPHKSLHEDYEIPVIFYDQVGNGNSTNITDVPETFWKVELWVSELDNLVKSLKIENNFDLLGHSWGGMLASQYAATYDPPGLKHLMISNSPASGPVVNEGLQRLLTQLPQGVQEIITKYESGTADPPLSLEAEEYKTAVMVFLQKHVCTLNPWPEGLLKSYSTSLKNKVIYLSMMGPYTLKVTGQLENWTVESIVHQISSPTLLLSSPRDQIQESSIIPLFLGIPKVKWVSLRDSTHFPHYEEPENYFKILNEFLGYEF